MNLNFNFIESNEPLLTLKSAEVFGGELLYYETRTSPAQFNPINSGILFIPKKGVPGRPKEDKDV